MAQPQSSCKRIVDEESGRPYFVYLVHRPLGDDLEEGSLDILLIDGTQAWAAEGLINTALTPASVPNRVRHMVEALSDLLPPSHDYTHRLHHAADGTAQLWARWVERAGKEMRVTVRAPLQLAEDSGRQITTLLGSLVTNLASLRSSAAGLEEQARQWRAAAEQSQRLVDDYVSRRVDEERETSQKVAALLNAKKAKMRELRRELDALRAEKESGAWGGSGAAGMEEDTAGGAEGEEEEGEEEAEGGSAEGDVKDEGGTQHGKGQVAESGAEDGEEEEQRPEDTPPRYEYD